MGTAGLEGNMSGRDQYIQVLQSRRRGEPSSLGVGAEWNDVKPEFYVDSRGMMGSVLENLRTLKNNNPPYGLVNYLGQPITTLEDPRRRDTWATLEAALSSTILASLNLSQPTVEACPYHETLSQKLGRRALRPLSDEHPGLDTLREVSAPGGVLASAFILPLLNRIPDMAKIHGATSDYETLARNSARSLLPAPLGHPQQYARAFTFCLTGRSKRDLSFDRGSFLPNELIKRYTTLERSSTGSERIGWSKPTTDFTLCTDVTVTSRVKGSELDTTGDNGIVYPAGTRLGDIEVDEPTIGCPGAPVAYAMWDMAIDIVVQENLWNVA